MAFECCARGTCSRKCCSSFYTQGVVVFAIFYYQVFGCGTLVAAAISPEKSSIWPYLFSTVAIILGIFLSIGVITRNERLVLSVFIMGVFKLVVSVIYAFFPNQELGVSDFGGNWVLFFVCLMMQHGIYEYYKKLETDEIIARNPDIALVE